MSADNGIYILRTPISAGFEYRVAHVVSCEVEYYRDKELLEDLDQYISYMWGPCSVFFTPEEAAAEAVAETEEVLAQGYPIEYGTSTIELDRSFPE